MDKVTLLGIDIAKNIFQLHGVDKRGQVVIRRSVRRGELLGIISKLPRCVIVLEACGSSNHWGREICKMGHEVRLISPQYVKPYVKTNKNDVQDAEAIVEAASRPSMRYVPIKGIEQQDIQSVHRIRERLVGSRTSLVNQVRGLLSEYGIVMKEGIAQVRKRLPEIVEERDNGLSSCMRELASALHEELLAVEGRIKQYDEKIKRMYQENEICQRLGEIEGIGPISASILLTVLSDIQAFKNGRHFAAYLGLVPKQYSSGGKQRILSISKRGDSYIRGLLIHGARSVLKNVDKKKDRRSRWIQSIKVRRGYNRASVALANKNARIAWALVAHGSEYKKVM